MLLPDDFGQVSGPQPVGQRGVLRRFGGLAFVAAEQVCHAVRVQDYALADQSPRHVDARRANRCRRATDLPDPSHVRTRACVLLPPQRGGVRHLRNNAEARWRRSEEHTSELQSLMRISYAVFCLKKKNNKIKLLTHRQM